MAFALKNKRSRTNAEIFTREFTSVRQGIALRIASLDRTT